MQLWEILVPTVRNDGRPIRTRFHGQLFTERMIPVRIACTREQIETIIDMTAAYYEQEAIMAFKISEEVIIKHFH